MLNQALDMGGFKARKSFMVTLDLDQIPSFSSWMLENGLGPGCEPQAIRELIKMQLSSEPLDGAIEAARVRAYHQTRAWAMERLMAFLDELRADFKNAPHGAPGLVEPERDPYEQP